MFKRLLINRRFILKRTFSDTSIIYAFIGFIGMFVSLDEIIKTEMSTGYKVAISLLILICVFVLCLFKNCICAFYKNRKKVVQGRNGKAVYVVYGDLFGDRIVRNHSIRRNICFAVNRCFDTVIDNKLIASASVHGAAFQKLYADKVYTPKRLNAAIQNAIPPTAVSIDLTRDQKPEGNLRRYDVGTAVDVPVSERLHYFLIGLSSLNSDLRAGTTLFEYCLAVQKMIEFCDDHAQGLPVLMPIIGGFLSRTGQTEKDLLQYIVNCFKINTEHINQDVYIVVRESAKNEISILDL